MRVIAYKTDNFVSRHNGTLPILITCPHGGDEVIPNVTERTERNTPTTCTKADKFTNGRDTGTIPIAQALAQKILDFTGESPYVVIANFHRRFVDANRPAGSSNVNCAFVDVDARAAYETYHKKIADFADEIRLNFGNKGFLFDVHGTNRIVGNEADLYIGTINGATLLSGFGKENLYTSRGLVPLFRAVRRPSEIAGTPEAFRYDVLPTNKDDAEVHEVSGGFTIRNYKTKLNCIQLEFAETLRDTDSRRTNAADDMAVCMVNFVRQHINLG